MGGGSPGKHRTLRNQGRRIADGSAKFRRKSRAGYGAAEVDRGGRIRFRTERTAEEGCLANSQGVGSGLEEGKIAEGSLSRSTPYGVDAADSMRRRRSHRAGYRRAFIGQNNPALSAFQRQNTISFAAHNPSELVACLKRDHAWSAVAAQTDAQKSGWGRGGVSQSAETSLSRRLPRNTREDHAGQTKIGVVDDVEKLYVKPQAHVLG